MRWRMDFCPSSYRTVIPTPRKLPVVGADAHISP